MEITMVADLFEMEIDNISSYTIEDTGELRVGIRPFDKGKIYQQSVVKVNLKKAIRKSGYKYGTSKLETSVWNIIPDMEY